MPRELRIAAVVTLPDDIFEEADALVAAKPILARLKEEFGGVAVVSFDIVTPKPRGGKADQQQQEGATE